MSYNENNLGKNRKYLQHLRKHWFYNVINMIFDVYKDILFIFQVLEESINWDIITVDIYAELFWIL